MDLTADNQAHRKILQRGRYSPRCDHRARPRPLAARTGLGWKLDHVIGYFAITLLVCFAWPRPFVVGGALMVFAGLLEALQSLTPDRTPNLWAAIYGAGGALAAALLAEHFIRVRRRRAG